MREPGRPRGASERARAGKRLGPLDGIPVSVKDNLFVQNMPASWGSLMLQDFIADRDDIFVERLRGAGAVIIGKTTTPEFALLGKTESRLKGVTRNPWDPRLTPGGSSGGAVASVAAGIVPIAFATDAGGSTRTPAGYTGLLGLRPSNGRIPCRYGFPSMALDFQAIGIVTRTVDDLVLTLDIVAGPDDRDPTSFGLTPFGSSAKPLRIGWFDGIGEERSDGEVSASLRCAVGVLSAAGIRIEECVPPFNLQTLRDVWGVLTSVGAARAALAFPSWEADATPQIAGLTRDGQTISAVDYVRAIDKLGEFRAEVGPRLAAFDALLMPSSASPAFPCEHDSPATIGGRPGSSATQGMFTGWVNAIGACGLNVPGELHPDGRPIGIQIVAVRGGEATPWRDRWPSMCP